MVSFYLLSVVALCAARILAAPGDDVCAGGPSASEIATAEAQFAANTKNITLTDESARKTLTISVFWHVIQKPGKAVTDGYLTIADMNKQIAVLNKAYKPAGLNFTLAARDYSPVQVWFRHFGPGTNPETQAKFKLHRGTKRLLNIYSTGFVDFPGLLGYATYPWNVAKSPKRDGVVIKYTTVKGGIEKDYNQGKLATGLACTTPSKGAAEVLEIMYRTPRLSQSQDLDVLWAGTRALEMGLTPYITMDNLPVESNLEDYVKSKEFDYECAVARLSGKARERVPASENIDSDYEDNIWSNSNDGTPSLSLHEISKIEAHLYYAGLGPNGRGPKLIYRTSDDKFIEPEGPEAYTRLMKLCPVPGDHELGQNGLWDRIRDQVVELLDKRCIMLTSVDLVKFTWLNKEDDQEIQEKEEGEDGDDDDAQKDLSYDDIPVIKPVKDGRRYTTNPTVWVGVSPDTLTGAVAHESAIEILGLLKELGIAGGVDVVYRESVVKFLHGPDLFAPVSDQDLLNDVVDSLSTSLSLPISGRKTTMRGTLGCYFRVGNDLYAITARHNMFPLKGDYDEYNYRKSVPKKKVVVMGARAFTKYLASIQANIGTLIDTVDSLEKMATTLTRRAEADGDDAQKIAGELEQTQSELAKTRTKIDTLKIFFVDIKRRWSKGKDRVIGYVVWAPPIDVGVPHRYTKDLCVIKLDKKKFKNFRGNVLSLGPEISPTKFKALMYDRIDVPSKFDYPEKGLLPVQGILSAADINNPSNMNLEGDRIRRVIKCGFTTKTTVGTLSSFMSHARKYFFQSYLDSVEVAILPHDNDSIAFSRGGDSGALIVDAHRRFVALITGRATSGTASSDITFATPMEWVWELVKDKFPGADLHFDDLEAFLGDVV